MEQQEPIQIEYDEIDLMDYMKVIIRKKWLILGVFLGVIIVAGVFSYLIPKVYKIDTVLEIGIFGGSPIENPIQVVGELNAGSYKITAMKDLGISEKDYPEIKTTIPGDTNLIIIEIESNNAERAKSVLEEVNKLILADQDKKLNKMEAGAEGEMEEIQKELTLVETQKVYADQSISGLQLAISDLKQKLNTTKATEVVKPPTISEIPISPRPLLNIAIAAVLGLFLGIFVAFIKEWWEKSSRKLNA